MEFVCECRGAGTTANTWGCSETPDPARRMLAWSRKRSVTPAGNPSSISPWLDVSSRPLDTLIYLRNRHRILRQISAAIAISVTSICYGFVHKRVVQQGPDLQNILRQSYDYLTIIPKWRSTYDRRLLHKTSYEGRKAFLWYNSLAKSSEILLVNSLTISLRDILTRLSHYRKSSYDKLKITLWQIVRYFVNRVPSPQHQRDAVRRDQCCKHCGDRSVW